MIVGAANSVIEHNKTKLDKIVWTANDIGEKVIVHRSMTDADEGRYVASTIWETKMNQQLQNIDFAVLYRTNAQSRAIEDALRKRDIPYRIYGGLSFYQRKEIKDVTAYLRLILNTSDEEALKRVINYPARGIGQTTIDRLVVAANATGKTIYDIMADIDNVTININNGTKNKLKDFVTLIESYKVMNQNANAFELAEHVAKTSGLIRELGKDGTPEGVTKLDNVQELLNGIKDFVEGQVEVADSTGSLAEFLEDIALATDLDGDKGDPNHVALMTIHLAKGLEFPHVFIVGMEEDLFPSAMSMNTRSELEEERRLFYVAITRAEKQAYLTYTVSRYRWGKLIDAEPSRFIEEIDDEFINITTPLKEQRFNPMLDASIFGDIEPNKVRFSKPKSPKFKKKETKKPENFQISTPKKLKPVSQTNTGANLFDTKLTVGNVVNHQRFGRGEVLKIEGAGGDLKAEIKFENGDTKKLLLRFAKLEIIS
jgi:DNA helicase-2/ATP-dependent DNA helicase PcrA